MTRPSALAVTVDPPPQDETTAARMDTTALSARGIVKAYPGVRALRGVDLELLAGQVHGLVGENGAGKSTLVKVLTGVVAPDAGSLAVAGVPIPSLDPRGARKLGIAAVHQEPSVVPALSPVANVFLGHPEAKAGILRNGAMRRKFLEWTDRLGVTLPTGGLAGDLSLGGQQTIEIIRALEQDARVIFMDEPTSSLGPEERRGLFRMIDSMCARGIAIVFISHKLDDVLAVATTVTVLRDGDRVAQIDAAQASPDTLIESMLGEALENVLDPPAPAAGPPDARPGKTTDTLRIRGLSVPGVLRGIDLELGRGEILGVAGLVGSGRSTLLHALAGASATAQGQMWVDGERVPWPHSPRQARTHGIVLAPEDRRLQGLVLSLSAGENLMLASDVPHSRWGLYARRRLFAAARVSGSRVGFAEQRVAAKAQTLSGGNQQKLILGRLASSRPSILLLDEPGRGIDIGAKAEIFTLIRSLAADGMSVVLVSEEIEEVIALATRILVLADGTIAEALTGADITTDRVLSQMLPARSAAVAGAPA